MLLHDLSISFYWTSHSVIHQLLFPLLSVVNYCALAYYIDTRIAQLGLKWNLDDLQLRNKLKYFTPTSRKTKFGLNFNLKHSFWFFHNIILVVSIIVLCLWSKYLISLTIYLQHTMYLQQPNFFIEVKKFWPSNPTFAVGSCGKVVSEQNHHLPLFLTAGWCYIIKRLTGVKTVKKTTKTGSTGLPGVLFSLYAIWNSLLS